jgi:hypothetical protein
MTDQLRLPGDFLTDAALAIAEGPVTLVLDWDRDTDLAVLADLYLIQRFLTVVQGATSVRLVWSEVALDALKEWPGQAALLGCAIQLEKPAHILSDGSLMSVPKRIALQQAVAAHRLVPNWFDAADSLVCSDNERRGWHSELYSGSGKLRPRTEFTRLVDPLIRAKVIGLSNEQSLIQWKDSLISVIYELFENTHIHARFGYDGKTLARDVVRTVIVRLVSASTGANEARIRRGISYECLEISVLDSGTGFFGSRFGRPISAFDELSSEWANLRLCLDKHVDDPLDEENSHRGVGLYEVLRALHFLHGAIQVRSGRTFGYRSFFPSDTRQQMEPRDSASRPGMPRGKLLDFNHPHRPTPTANAEVRGVAVRTLIPLRWDE